MPKNVRNTPAGTKITTLNVDDLMYDVAGVDTVTATLNGTSYVWGKVHYYKSTGNTTVDGEGWVPRSLATAVSAVVPSSANTYFSNASLTQHQRLVNARYIYNYLRNCGWSSNAIYATLGNMEAESSINPGAYNGFATPSSNRAYGLVQWNPPSKLRDWLAAGNRSDTITNQLARVNYEANNEVQWMKNLHSPSMTFAQYMTSSKSYNVLAEYFLRCYEHPGNESNKVQERQTNAKKWATLIGILVN